MLVKMRSLSVSIGQSLPRLLAEDTNILGFTAIGQGLGLTHPIVAIDAALEIQVAIHPFAFILLPRSHLPKGVDAQAVQDALDLRTNAGDQLEVIGSGRLVDTLRTAGVF